MTDETNVTELLPCPFCGSEELMHGSDYPGWDGRETTGNVQCGNCDAFTLQDTEADAIAAWNTRLAHSLPSQADAGERSKIVAWLRSIDEGPLKGWQPNALANAIERGDYFRLADESLAVDQLQAMGQDFDATSGEEMRLREENARLRAHIAASANSINAAGSAYDEAIAALDRLVAETKSSARAALTKGADRHD